jgi:soluble lytic murein transglycosylase-like protein
MGVPLHIPTRALARLYRLARGGLALFGLVAVIPILPMMLPLQSDIPVERVIAATLSRVAIEWSPADQPISSFETEPNAEAGPDFEVEPDFDAVPLAEVEPPLEPRQRALAGFIAQRYRVAESASAAYVSTAYRSGHELSIDPLLVLAVIAVESRYNPVAESSKGAKGLMQVIPRYHMEKLLAHGGERALLEPEVNIQVGAQILQEYMARAGVMEIALQMYNGALDEPTARYAGKVLAERERLRQFLTGAVGGV